MKERPKLKLEHTEADKTVEIIGWLLIFAVWILTIINYQSLPDIIPTHYNGAGVADGFGDKWMILTLPIVATVLFVGLTILNKFPHIFNYPAEITADNALRQYTNATRLIRYLKVIIVIIFGLIAFQTIRHANGQTEGLGIWFLPMTMGLIFIPLIYYLIKSTKTK
ncbi:hypothetical protein CHU92_12600 [Flavobacterium cyanobacteriorum]|uniref:DUF1648 domain-containing protein n=1 Tax=Flavobacterium cyanobacteriorum TaxID=2022802 RepID=A0A255YXI2_9FLAO|nr:DUF1648 domain-containing protein [Flavobacterium cyanobacteriorum]OYQ33922.1 hypothetical protein CHU92_12600 [Flavobacterium cyanobacteriorum]